MIYFALAGVLVAMDQATKWYMTDLLPLCRVGQCVSIEILPVARFVLVHNEGASFSFLADAGGWQRWFLVVVSTVVSAAIAVWLYRIRRSEKLLALSLAFILGGAIGNLVDRASLGYVVDFISLYYESWYFPVFNLADTAISVGAALLILDMLIGPGEERLVEN